MLVITLVSQRFRRVAILSVRVIPDHYWDVVPESVLMRMENLMVGMPVRNSRALSKKCIRAVSSRISSYVVPLRSSHVPVTHLHVRKTKLTSFVVAYGGSRVFKHPDATTLTRLSTDTIRYWQLSPQPGLLDFSCSWVSETTLKQLLPQLTSLEVRSNQSLKLPPTVSAPALRHLKLPILNVDCWINLSSWINTLPSLTSLSLVIASKLHLDMRDLHRISLLTSLESTGMLEVPILQQLAELDACSFIASIRCAAHPSASALASFTRLTSLVVPWSVTQDVGPMKELMQRVTLLDELRFLPSSEAGSASVDVLFQWKLPKLRTLDIDCVPCRSGTFAETLLHLVSTWPTLYSLTTSSLPFEDDYTTMRSHTTQWATTLQKAFLEAERLGLRELSFSILSEFAGNVIAKLAKRRVLKWLTLG